MNAFILKKGLLHVVFQVEYFRLCDCNWRFKTSSALERHFVIHTGEKVYQCPCFFLNII